MEVRGHCYPTVSLFFSVPFLLTPKKGYYSDTLLTQEEVVRWMCSLLRLLEPPREIPPGEGGEALDLPHVGLDE